MVDREATQFIFENKTRPMSEEDFADVELAIRSLRDMTGDDEYEFVVVAFENHIDKLDFIQSYATESYKTCYIEIGFLREGKDFPQIFAIDEIPVDRTVEIFKSICCSEINPDLSEWKDKTQEILKEEGKEDK